MGWTVNKRDIPETVTAVRAVMPQESTIDLDLHAHAIAVVVTEARRRARGLSITRHAELARELLDHARSLA